MLPPSVGDVTRWNSWISNSSASSHGVVGAAISPQNGNVTSWWSICSKSLLGCTRGVFGGRSFSSSESFHGWFVNCQFAIPRGDSRLSEIEGVLLHAKRAGRLHKLLGIRRWRDSTTRHKLLEHLAQKRIRSAIAGDVEAEKTACGYAAFSASAFHAGWNIHSNSCLVSSWNVNRTSVPGLVTNKIVPPSCGMRSMSSAFRQLFHPHNKPYET